MKVPSPRARKFITIREKIAPNDRNDCLKYLIIKNSRLRWLGLSTVPIRCSKLRKELGDYVPPRLASLFYANEIALAFLLGYIYHSRVSLLPKISSDWHIFCGWQLEPDKSGFESRKSSEGTDSFIKNINRSFLSFTMKL